MISSLILAFSPTGAVVSPEGVVRSLAAMVPVAIESLVRDVILAGPRDAEPGPNDLQAIADHAGCSLIICADEREALRLGSLAARQDLLLVMRAGFIPRQNFLTELSEFVGRGAPRFKRGAALREEYKGLWRALAFRAPAAGLLAPKSSILEANASTLDELTRRIRPDATFSCGGVRLE